MGKAKNRLTPTTALKTGSGFRLMPEARGFFYPNAENPYPNAIGWRSGGAQSAGPSEIRSLRQGMENAGIKTEPVKQELGTGHVCRE